MAKTDENKEVLSEKMKALQLAMDKIDKDFGKGAIMRWATAKLRNFGYPNRFAGFGCGTWRRWLSERSSD